MIFSIVIIFYRQDKLLFWYKESFARCKQPTFVGAIYPNYPNKFSVVKSNLSFQRPSNTAQFNAIRQLPSPVLILEPMCTLSVL